MQIVGRNFVLFIIGTVWLSSGDPMDTSTSLDVETKSANSELKTESTESRHDVLIGTMLFGLGIADTNSVDFVFYATINDRTAHTRKTK